MQFVLSSIDRGDYLKAKMNSLSPTIPEGLDVVPCMDGVVIQKSWLNWTIAPLALFAIVWDSFLCFWYSKVLEHPNPPLMAILFPIGHVAVGIGITYFVVASLVNKTVVVITRSSVKIATGPAPWIGNKEVRSDEITEVIVRERSANRGSRKFTVMYADASRKERKLLGGLGESEQAEFVAQMIRETLGLTTPGA